MAYLPAVGVSWVVLRHLHSLSDFSKERLSIAFNKFLLYNIFGTFFRTYVAPAKGEIRMSDTEKLMAYILTLTPEQVEKVVSQLPLLTALLSKSAQPSLQELSEQIA
jgi:hypothetical protein